MHSIGNARDAGVILAWVRSHRSSRYGKPDCVDSESAPEGWDFVGTGSFRSVWRSPEGVAYKVNHSGDYDSQSGDEVMHLEFAWNRQDEVPEGCRLPKFDEFRVDEEIVVAIEHIIGVTLYEYSYRGMDGVHPNRDTLYDRLYECENTYGLGDLHDENVIIESSTGMLVPVDFGG